MKYHMLGVKILTVFTTCLILQSCFVQKNSETHATMIFDPYPAETSSDTEVASIVTVEENNEHKASLEVLSASLLLIDFHNEHKINRWEDHLSYKTNDQKIYNQPDQKNDQEVSKPITNRN